MEAKMMDVLRRMQPVLDEMQLRELKEVLQMTFTGCRVIQETDLQVVDRSWEADLEEFLMSKALEGKAPKTVKQYRYELVRLLTYINKPVKNIDSGDISGFMRTYKMIRKVANQTLKNVRAVYSSFFGWLRDRDRIRRNPMVLVESIKVEKKIRKPYTTAVRVSELAEINREDIRYANKELIVYGKGAKERTVYINERTNMYLKEYLESRKDNNPALFVGSKKPNSRLTKTGIEDIIRRIGEKAGVENAHPHRFRRTALTNALNRGMPLQEAMIFAGHAKSETTMRYCTVNQEGVRYHHFKYLSA